MPGWEREREWGQKLHGGQSLWSKQLCSAQVTASQQSREGRSIKTTLARTISSQITVVAPGTQHPDGSVSFPSHEPLLSYRWSQPLIPGVLPVKWKATLHDL